MGRAPSLEEAHRISLGRISTQASTPLYANIFDATAVMDETGISLPSLPPSLSTLVTIGGGGAASFFGPSDVGSTITTPQPRRRWPRSAMAAAAALIIQEMEEERTRPRPLARSLARSLDRFYIEDDSRPKPLSRSILPVDHRPPTATDRCVTGLLIAKMRPRRDTPMGLALEG